MSSDRRSFEPIKAEPSEAWRNLVYKADTKSRKGQRAVEMAETTWMRCESAASSMLNSKPGGDNYSQILPRVLMSEAGGISPSTFYGHRIGPPVRGVLSVDRAVASIVARSLAEDIIPLSEVIDHGDAEDIPEFYLTGYLQEVIRFSADHPEDARGFLRAMFEGVYGQECQVRVEAVPAHPALVVIDPVSKLLSASGASSIYADAEHIVRLVMSTGISAGLGGDDVSIGEVKGIERFLEGY